MKKIVIEIYEEISNKNVSSVGVFKKVHGYYYGRELVIDGECVDEYIIDKKIRNYKDGEKLLIQLCKQYYR